MDIDAERGQQRRRGWRQRVCGQGRLMVCDLEQRQIDRPRRGAQRFGRLPQRGLPRRRARQVGRLNMRNFCLTGVSLGAAALLAACGGSGASSTTSTSTSTSTTTTVTACSYASQASVTVGANARSVVSGDFNQ